LNNAQRLADAAAQRYNDALAEAQPKFIKAKESDPTLELVSWVVENVPDLAVLEKDRGAAQADLAAKVGVYYGPRAAEVSGYVSGVQSALSQESSQG